MSDVCRIQRDRPRQHRPHRRPTDRSGELSIRKGRLSSPERRGVGQRGSALIEFPLVIGLILIPFGMLAISATTWVERQTAARDAAAESARAIVLADVDGGVDPMDVVRQIEQGYDLPAGSLRAAMPANEFVPGESVTVTVTVEIPALALPILGDVGAVDWTAEHTERFPDFGADR